MAHPSELHVCVPDCIPTPVARVVVSVVVVVVVEQPSAPVGAGPSVMNKVNVAARYVFLEPHLVSTALSALAVTIKVPADVTYSVTSIFWQFDDFDHSHVFGSHS